MLEKDRAIREEKREKKERQEEKLQGRTGKEVLVRSKEEREGRNIYEEEWQGKEGRVRKRHGREEKEKESKETAGHGEKRMGQFGSHKIEEHGIK